MSTPEGKVKEGIKKVLHKYGMIAAGSVEKNWPTPVTGWYYMPIQNGMGVHGIMDFIGKFLGFAWTLEAKAPGNIDGLTPNQVQRHVEMRQSPGAHFVADDAAQFERDFCAYFHLQVN